MNNECSCETCKNACSHKPGWFMPNEAGNYRQDQDFVLFDVKPKW